jgi:hypothetical protein
MYIEGGQIVTELYRECKVDCGEGNRHLVGCVKYREILYCEFNIQLFKQKKSKSQQHERGSKMGKEI